MDQGTLAAGCCWRCRRTDTERREVLVPIEGMDEPQLLEECVERLRLDCVATRWHDRKPGPGLGEGVRQMYQTDYDAHRDCGPDCLLARQALGHLIASNHASVNPETGQ